MMISTFLAFTLAATALPAQTRELFDEQRQRQIPIEISLPTTVADCSEKQPCKVAPRSDNIPMPDQ